VASQGLFCYTHGVANSYREHLKKLEGDTLAVMVNQMTIPLSGIMSVIDWRLNSTISNLIISEKYKARPGETLLLNTENALGIPKTLIIGTGKGYKNDLSKALKGLRTKNLSIVLGADVKKDKQVILSELQNQHIKWRKASAYNMGEENLIVLKDIEY
jgi:hypothetical protein